MAFPESAIIPAGQVVEAPGTADGALCRGFAWSYWLLGRRGTYAWISFDVAFGANRSMGFREMPDLVCVWPAGWRGCPRPTRALPRNQRPKCFMSMRPHHSEIPAQVPPGSAPHGTRGPRSRFPHPLGSCAMLLPPKHCGGRLVTKGHGLVQGILRPSVSTRIDEAEVLGQLAPIA